MPNHDESVESRVGVIEDALRGDLTGQPGLIQHMMRVLETLHKEPHGLVDRVAGLERKTIVFEERAKGAAMVLTVLKVIIGALVGLGVGKLIFK